MEDTEWFEEKSEDEKFVHLLQMMYSDDTENRTQFQALLKLLPVDLVKFPQPSINSFENDVLR